MTEIAKYTVGVAFDLKQKEWKNLDKQLKKLEARLQKASKVMQSRLAFSIDKFVVNQRNLNIALGNALDRSSRMTTFSIEKFDVNQAELTRKMTSALRRATAAASSSANVNPDVNVGRGGITGRHAGIAGGVGGLAARAYMPLLAIAGGGYGLGALNRRNQEIVSAQLQSQAIVQQAGGTAQQGQASFQWLQNQGDRVGFNWLQAVGDYNKLLSGLTGAGMSVEQGQGVFKGFSELARVNKLDQTSQNRLFRALSQVAGKDRLMSEELTGQIAEALPGGVSIFAEAYQRQLAAQGKGGGKTGAEAIQELRAGMEAGQVRGDILLYAGTRAGEMAAPGLQAAMTASQAEQARFQNEYNRLAKVASDSGVESGFARLFRAMSDGTRESLPLVRSLAGGFDELTKYAASALLTFQSIQRFFQGRDSLIGDKLFPDEKDREAAFTWLANLKAVFGEFGTLLGNIANGWKMLFGAMDWSVLLTGASAFLSVIRNLLGALNSAISGNYGEAVEQLKSAVSTATTPARFVANEGMSQLTGFMASRDNRISDPSGVQPIQIPSALPSTPDYATEKEAQRMLATANNRKAGYPNPTGIFPMASGGGVTATFNIYDATNAEEVGVIVRTKLEDMFNGVKAENPDTE